MTPTRELDTLALNDGHELPAVGLGTFGMTGPDGVATVLSGLRAGHRLLDTAVGYGNETEVGEALRRTDVPTSEILVTTKIRGRGMGYEAARRSIEASRHVLGVERIGLHLIHWPMPWLERHVDTWRALVDARADGEVRSIGVSNFTATHLEAIVEATGVVPAVNQIELHPHHTATGQRKVDAELGVLTQSWSPLGRGRALLDAAAVREPAHRLGVSPAQVVLRWHHQLGALPIPRSNDPRRQRENLEIGGFALTDDEIAAISALDTPDGRLWGADPEHTGFM